MLETVGDTMRASIDGKAVAFLQSPGIAHPTKSKVEFGRMGKGGYLMISEFGARRRASRQTGHSCLSTFQGRRTLLSARDAADP